MRHYYCRLYETQNQIWRRNRQPHLAASFSRNDAVWRQIHVADARRCTRLYTPGHAIVDCMSAVWTHRYTTGHIVTLRGPLTAHLVICLRAPQPSGAPPYMLKFEDFELEVHSHETHVALDAKRKAEDFPPGAEDHNRGWEEPRLVIENGSIPAHPVSVFGIPQATMRCLEVSLSVKLVN